MRTLPHSPPAVLESGARVITVPMPSLHRVVIQAHIRVGPRFEAETDNGISHFLEHMLYRGTPSHPSAHAQALAFESLGGTLVAATAVDHGTLAIAVPPESLEATLPLFCEVFQNPIYSGIEIEKGIVREEILESLDDERRAIDADELVRALTFGDHPLGFPITGSLAHLERLTQAKLSAHHDRFYVGENTVLTVAGPVDSAHIEACLAKGFQSLPRGAVPTITPPPAQERPLFRAVRHQASQTALRVAFRAPGEREPLEPATEMLLRVIDDGMSTRLYHRICDARGLCYDVSAAYEAYADVGLFDIAAETEHERAIDVLEEVMALVEELAAHGPQAAELDKAKTRYGWQLRELLDDAAETAEFLGFEYLSGSARTPQERFEALSSLSIEDVRRAAESVFSRAGTSVVAVGLLSKKTRDALERRVLG